MACKPPGCVLPAGPDAPAAFAAVARVTLVRADVPADAIAHHHQDTPWRLPVVDEGDRFVGFFMGGGAQGPQWPWQRAAVALARDLVVGESLLLVETEPVGNALRLMARRGVRSLALADESGVFQGVLFDVDALRAFAG